MNSYQRAMGRLCSEPVDRPPNFDIMMIFAAHHIGRPLSHYYQYPRVLCEANLAVLDTFDLDIVQSISDPYRETADFGAEIAFPEDGLPISTVPLLREPEDLKDLRPPDPRTGRRMSDRLRANQLLREQVGGEVPIMGWVEGALAEAGDLRGVSQLMIDLYDRPAWVEEVLELCVSVAIEFAQAQIEAGADIIGLGDAIASQISPRMYLKYGLPYERRIFDAIHEMGAIGRLHICGDITAILSHVVRTGADIIDVDWMVDIGQAAAAFGDGPALCGNFDPVAVMLYGTPEQVHAAVTECALLGGLKSFSGAGCEIPDATPHENLHAQTHALRELHTSIKE
jgi:MtaA/CmuA family methyltransferase